MKNHTLGEIKDELYKEIEILESKEEKYLRCRKCPFKGKCCIDNDIDIREDEWNLIREFLDNHADARNEVYDNFIHDHKCYFRTEKCCLIHPIRPTNCIYTPYQLIQNRYDNVITYSLMDENCDFITKEMKMEHELEIDEPVIYLEQEKSYFLFLNHWFEKYENQSEDTYKMLGHDRLMEYFGK